MSTAKPKAKSSKSSAPGMDDVAALAGVSPQTVSRTLRGYPHVSEKARAKVLAAVAQLGYRRNGNAAALASGRSRALGVVALGEGSFRFDVMKGIAATADRAGYTVNMVTAASQRSEDIVRAVSRLLDQSVAGIILALTIDDVDEELDRLIASVPTIAVSGARAGWAEAIAVDSEAATRNAVRYLLDLGHPTVHYVAGVGSSALTNAWLTELERAGATVPPLLEGDWTPESGLAIGTALARTEGVTAVLVAGDEMAFGVIRAMTAAGNRIPEDVSIMGSSDTPFSAWTSPPLSSIDEPLDERGARAARYLLHRLDGESGPFDSEWIVPQLVIRGSTRAPRSSEQVAQDD